MTTRFGAAELYGNDLAVLPPDKVRTLSSANNREMPCPFKPHPPNRPLPTCSKKGGVCSLRQYSKDEVGSVQPSSEPVSTCPYRFLERNFIFHWVGEVLLGTQNPAVISELPFLMGDRSEERGDLDAVGMIDKVLVSAEGSVLKWCALEMQAVYFSGMSMENDFKYMRTWQGPGIPFPQAQRRPDFRSSGPKRLMPQLQIKVPTISRWGKKVAVVVDLPFWESLGEMREVRDLSNSEIAWFVVAFGESQSGRIPLERHSVHFTTLSHAVEGLTGGTPISLESFEHVLRSRISENEAS
jgi:restriction endonuclease NotI